MSLYVNLTGIYDVKYIMYDNLLELVFDKIKKAKVEFLQMNKSKLNLIMVNMNYILKLKITRKNKFR